MAVNVLQMLLVLAALIFALQQPGDIQITWQDHSWHYALSTALLALLLGVLAILLLHRLLLTLAAIPARWQRRQQNKRLARSLTALTTGLTAVTLGDAKTANEAALQAQKYAAHPQSQALIQVLHAQIARLQGDELAVQQHLTALSQDPLASNAPPAAPAETI